MKRASRTLGTICTTPRACVSTAQNGKFSSRTEEGDEGEVTSSEATSQLQSTSLHDTPVSSSSTDNLYWTPGEYSQDHQIRTELSAPGRAGIKRHIGCNAGETSPGAEEPAAKKHQLPVAANIKKSNRSTSANAPKQSKLSIEPPTLTITPPQLSITYNDQGMGDNIIVRDRPLATPFSGRAVDESPTRRLEASAQHALDVCGSTPTTQAPTPATKASSLITTFGGKAVKDIAYATAGRIRDLIYPPPPDMSALIEPKDTRLIRWLDESPHFQPLAMSLESVRKLSASSIVGVKSTLQEEMRARDDMFRPASESTAEGTAQTPARKSQKGRLSEMGTKAAKVPQTPALQNREAGEDPTVPEAVRRLRSRGVMSKSAATIEETPALKPKNITLKTDSALYVGGAGQLSASFGVSDEEEPTMGIAHSAAEAPFSTSSGKVQNTDLPQSSPDVLNNDVGSTPFTIRRHATSQPSSGSAADQALAADVPVATIERGDNGNVGLEKKGRRKSLRLKKASNDDP